MRRKPDRYRDAAAYPDAPRVQWFLSRAARLRSVVYGSAVGTFVLACILLAGALVGMQTYPSMKTDPVVQGLDFFVLCVFALEVVGKVVAEGLAPWRYVKRALLLLLLVLLQGCATAAPATTALLPTRYHCSYTTSTTTTTTTTTSLLLTT